MNEIKILKRPSNQDNIYQRKFFKKTTKGNILKGNYAIPFVYFC